MPLSPDQLRQLLDQRSEPARDRPVPQERIRARIRRARARRAAAVGLAAAVVIVGVVSAAALIQWPSPGPAVVTGQRFPASFTASDGTFYRRVAGESMTAAQRSVTVKLAVGKDPVDVMAACDGHGLKSAGVSVRAGGAAAALFTCRGGPQLVGLPVRLNHQADITFTKLSAPFGLHAAWQFAIYQWQPPATLRPAPARPQMPKSYTGPNTTTGQGTAVRREIATRSGDWPYDHTATFTLAGQGRNFDISAVCAGAIAGRLSVTMLVNGQKASTVDCTTAKPGRQPAAIFGAAASRPITLTFHLDPPSADTAAAYAKRAASWTIAIYEEQF